MPTIPLDPLSAEDAAALAERLLPPDGGANALGRIIETAGGNPLFLEELSASVAELGAGADLPITVREAIAARIDALPADARGTLLSAAVVGRTFWRGVVEILGEVSDVDSALAQLEARDLVRRDSSSQLAGDVQFTFKHMLIREVAYATVPRAVRWSWTTLLSSPPTYCAGVRMPGRTRETTRFDSFAEYGTRSGWWRLVPRRMWVGLVHPAKSHW